MAALVMDETSGIRMGDGFMGSLRMPAPLKDYITNDNVLEDGVEYDDFVPKQSSREITLPFVVIGKDAATFESTLEAFYQILYSGVVELTVPKRSDKIYRLRYKSHVSYAESNDGRMCKVSVKFVEPDPTDRGAISIHETE